MRYILIVLMFLTFNACGYKIAGYSDGLRYKYFIEFVKNNSNDKTITQDINRYVRSFFNDKGILETKEKADYAVRATLESINIKSAITTSSNDSVISTIVLRYRITVMDNSGITLYDNVIEKAQNIVSSGNVTSYFDLKEEALEDLTNEVLTRFKYEYETRV